MQPHEIIRALREDHDLNQTYIADILQTNQKKISRLEIGKQDPTLSELKALCQFYNVSADYILGLPKNMPYPDR